jgi:FtsZ-binding cell division protein ZapB
MQEFSELKESNSTLVEEVKWQKGPNSQLNDMIVKLKQENNILKKVLVKENGTFKDKRCTN